MDQSQLQWLDQKTIRRCVNFIKQHNSTRMIEKLYAPNQKNSQKKTKTDKIYLSVKKRINQIILTELKKKQMKLFNKRNRLYVVFLFPFLICEQHAQESDEEHDQCRGEKDNFKFEQKHQLKLFDNGTVINAFDKREDFLKEIERIELGVQKLQQSKLNRDKEEINRIAIQFDHHKYYERFKIDIDIVLGALLGAATSDKEVSKHGFRKKIKRFHLDKK